MEQGTPEFLFLVDDLNTLAARWQRAAALDDGGLKRRPRVGSGLGKGGLRRCGRLGKRGLDGRRGVVEELASRIEVQLHVVGRARSVGVKEVGSGRWLSRRNKRIGEAAGLEAEDGEPRDGARTSRHA